MGAYTVSDMIAMADRAVFGGDMATCQKMTKSNLESVTMMAREVLAAYFGKRAMPAYYLLWRVGE